MIFPDTTAEEWSERYGLAIREIPCRACGKILRTEIPFALSDGWRGLISAPHGCGPRYDVSTARQFDEQGRDLWADLTLGLR